MPAARPAPCDAQMTMALSAASSTLPPASPRLISIDVFRGATIIAMILVNQQFSHEASYRQLAHAAWNGWTFADTIFPCFLFIVGVSLALSTASRVARGETRTRLIGHALVRSLLMFACGMVIDHLRVPVREFPFVGLESHLQFTGVLQNIAVCYLVAFHRSAKLSAKCAAEFALWKLGVARSRRTE